MLAYTRGFAPHARFADEAKPWSRWRALAPYDCNAGSDYEALLGVLRGYSPASESRVRISNAFDIGRASRSYHFHSGLPDGVMAVYQIFRLSEITGIPHVANHVVLLREGIATAVSILADREAMATALRALRTSSGGGNETLDQHFTRARVARLSEPHAHHLWDVAIRQAHQSFRNLTSEPTKNRWMHRLSSAIELLSRLVLRFNDEEANEAFRLTIQLNASSLVRREAQIYEPLQNLISRTLEAFTADMLFKSSPILFGTQFTANSTVSWDRHYPEPSLLLPTDFVPKLASWSDRDPKWRTVIEDLLLSARGIGEVRSRSLGRLGCLLRWNMLGDDERTNLGSALWLLERLDEHGLPVNHPFMDWYLLFLPNRLRVRPMLRSGENTFQPTR